ncbi:MAG: hypothetical protein ABJA57_02455 [Ginsengibacter sp.]
MKKIGFLLLFVLSLGAATFAQEVKDKVKKTKTLNQRVHNTFSKHKHYKGYKAKHKSDGVTKKHKVDNATGEVKNKTK